MNKIFKYRTLLFIAFNIIQLPNKNKIEEDLIRDLCNDFAKNKS